MNQTRIRNATPPEFRDVLLAIARSATKTHNAEVTGVPGFSGTSG